MLSTGEFHKLVPREMLSNLRYREAVLKKAHNNPRVQAQLREACRRDLLFFINTFVWQYNPRQGGDEYGPFNTWDFQDKALRSILDSIECHCPRKPGVHQHDIIIVKSREMGASWLCLLICVWLLLFHKRKKMLVMSRSAEAVDSPDADSLFWKVDFVLSYLPDWMKPAAGIRRQIKTPYFGNPDTMSSLTGTASTAKAGVGGRATLMFIDEFSQIDEAREVLHRTSDTTGCRIFNGTHRGIGSAFHELSVSQDIRKCVMHWTQHPLKNGGLYRYDAKTNRVVIMDTKYKFPPEFNYVLLEKPTGGPYPTVRSPWYDEEVKRKTSERAIAMDLDIDPGGSVAQVFNALTIRALIQDYAVSPYWEGNIGFDRETGRPFGLVKQPGGALKMWTRPTPEGKMPLDFYGAGSDISTGNGATNSTLSIGSARTGEKVAEFASCTIPPEQFAGYVSSILWLFLDEFGRPPLFAWEHQGPGQIFGLRMLEFNYPNLYRREAGGVKLFNRPTDLLGWVPSAPTKRELIDEYRSAIELRQCVNRSELALEETLAYRWGKAGQVEHPSDVGSDDPTGARVNHGDRVIGDSLMWKMIRLINVLGQRSVEQEAEVKPSSLEWRRNFHQAQRGSSWDEEVALSARGW
jgi:hypothetical protein